MTSCFELVRAAVGDPDLSEALPRKNSAAPSFELFDVDLPVPNFSGIPREWVFAVLDPERANKSAHTSIDEARSILGVTPKSKLVVLISADPSVRLIDEFDNVQRDVFCLDATNLPMARKYKTEPRLAPFILAIQRRLNVNPALARAFSPYHRNIPASGWRFFGRDKQLKTIIEGTENLVVVGARRIGKTSLLREAERRLTEEGRTVYYVDVQQCETANDVVGEILRSVSPREAAAAKKHREVFQESVFSNLLRNLASKSEKTVLLLDELGNVLTRLPKEDWKFTGALRKFGQKGNLKFVISCFQEVFFRQQQEFEGPLINFGSTLRLGPFSRNEVEEFVIAPLDFWRPLGSIRGQLLDLVVNNVGRHPLFLQYFCQAFFEGFAKGQSFDPLKQAHILLRKDLHEWFSTAVDEVFFRIPSQLIQYLFLRRCQQTEAANRPLIQAEINDDWLEEAIDDLGYESTVRGRRNIMDGLEMHGLCAAIDNDRAKRTVAAPLVYIYVRQTVTSVDSLLSKLSKEVGRESEMWELRKRDPAMGSVSLR